MFRTEKFITRAMVRSHPKVLFVFGDNMRGTGFGGQARFMRGEPNAIGIPTKWSPSQTPQAYFTDDDFPRVRAIIETRFDILRRHLHAGGDVVWPEDGVGTGLAELQQRAPRIWNLIDTLRAFLEQTKPNQQTGEADAR